MISGMRLRCRQWGRRLTVAFQITRQDRQGHHGLREQNYSTMGRLDRRVQELLTQEDGYYGTSLGAAFPKSGMA